MLLPPNLAYAMIHDSDSDVNKPFALSAFVLLVWRCFWRCRAARRRTTSRDDVTVQAFVKPAGERLQLAGARAAEGHARRRLSGARQRLSGSRAARAAAARRRHAVDLPTSSRSTKARRRLPKPRVVATQVSLESDRRSPPYEEALAHVTGPELAEQRERLSGTRCCSTCCSSTRSTRTDPLSRSDLGLARLAARVVTVLRFLPPGGAVRAFEFLGDPGLVPARSALASGRAALRRAGFLPHPRRHRPPAVPVLPGDSVPPLPRADSGGDRVHGGALDHADRVGLRPGARTRCGFRR